VFAHCRARHSPTVFPTGPAKYLVSLDRNRIGDPIAPRCTKGCKGVQRVSRTGQYSPLSELRSAAREERGGFTGIFEIVAADKARVGRVKRRPFARGTSIAAPINPSRPLLSQSTLASLPDPEGELGQGTRPQPSGRPTDDPTGDDLARRSRSRRGCHGRG